jgi:hypothetical protein
MSIIQKNIRYPSACRAPPRCPFRQPIMGGMADISQNRKEYFVYIEQEKQKYKKSIG